MPSYGFYETVFVVSGTANGNYVCALRDAARLRAASFLGRNKFGVIVRWAVDAKAMMEILIFLISRLVTITAQTMLPDSGPTSSEELSCRPVRPV
jgi:hypothetical protein